ncbi:MAG: CBS domain-containing protein [Nitrosomonadales bacterium]|nr:CBS domain-containing protein [Nitrosomonadales bacterium]
MTKSFTALTSHPFRTGTDIARPTQVLPEHVTLEDPAVNVMTDLRSISVLNVRAKTTLDKANAKMIRYGVRMLLVTDDSDKVCGVLTATDVLGDRPVRFLQEMGGTHADIQVRDVMSVVREMSASLLEDVLKARVGNVLAMLTVAGRQHALVVETNADGSQTVRGLFSATQIARQLGVQIGTTEIAKVFAAIDAKVRAK